MKIRHLSILPFIIVCSLFLSDDEDEIQEQVIATGIYLDTMQNEVMLKMEEGYPAYYFSKIFTPVCNTGECLPVYVNIYWDLSGKYQRYDQPEGEILTKLDHEPFTEEDYNLLNEILHGPDPRYASMVKHSDRKGRDGKQDTQSQPAPEAMQVMTKYEMVDGITGSTLPELKDQFVPGALYTTYTLWGLANDHLSKMRNYTRKILIKPAYSGYLLTNRQHNCQDLVIEELSKNCSGKNPRLTLLMSLLDTGSTAVQLVALNKIYWDDYQSEIVINQLHRTFFSGHDTEVKRVILQRWSYNYCDDQSLIELSNNISENNSLTSEIVTVFMVKPAWPPEVFENLLHELDELDDQNRDMIVTLIKSKKNTYPPDDWKKAKKILKKY